MTNETYRARPLKWVRTATDGSVRTTPVDPETIRALGRKGPPGIPPRRAEPFEKVALRCWVEPDGWAPKSKTRRRIRWKETFLVLHTLGAAGESGPLWFGVAMLCHGERVLRAWLLHRDGIPASDIDALARAAQGFGWPAPLPLGDGRRGFLRAFRHYAHRMRTPVVGHGLPAHLARLAADWRPGKVGTFFEGGFVLVLGTKDPPQGRARWKGKERRLRNGRVEEGDYPTIGLKSIEGSRAFMSFMGIPRPKERDRIPEGGEGEPVERYHFPGHFVDLVRSVHPFAGENLTLGKASQLIGIDPPPPTPAADAPIEARITHLVAEAETIRRLYRATVARHREIAGDGLAPDEVFSAASYAPALYEEMGLKPPLVRWPHFPRHVLGWFASAIFSGRTQLGVRRIPEVALPVVALDFTGLYGAVSWLLGIWQLLTAKRLDVVEEDPHVLMEWIAGLTPGDLLSPKTWRRLLCIVQMVPTGDQLPHRIRPSKAWSLSVGPLTWRGEPMWFCLADVIVSFLETGSVPEILRAVRLVPGGRVEGLRPIDLPSLGTFDPNAQGADFLWFLTEGRARLKQPKAGEIPDPWGGQLASFYKTLVSAACSGILMRTDRSEVRRGGWKSRVWGPWSTGPEDCFSPRPRSDRVDIPGPWCFPPAAALVLAGGRLAEALALRVVHDAGGTTAYADTDSVYVVGMSEGGIVPCPGGRERTDEGVEAVRALSWNDVESIRARIEELSPYPAELRPYTHGWAEQPSYPDRFTGRLRRQRALPMRVELPYFLKLTGENFDGGPSWRRQTYFWGLRSKAYALYFLDEPGLSMRFGPPPEVVYPTEEEYRAQTVVRIVKASGHGLAHLTDPRDLGSGDSTWIEEAYCHLIRRDLGLALVEPDFLDEPALSVACLSHPGLLPPGAGLGRLSFLWPFGRVLQAHVLDRGFRPKDEPLVVPLAPFVRGAGIPRTWVDRGKGRRLPGIITASKAGSLGAFVGGPTVVEDHRSVLRGLSRGTERKARTATGEATSATSAGQLLPRAIEAYDVVLIGKEVAITPGLPMGAVEVSDEHYTTYRPSGGVDGIWECALVVLRDYRGRAAKAAEERGVPGATFRWIVVGRNPSKPHRAALMHVAGTFAREGLRTDEHRRATPEDDERAVYAYAKESGRGESKHCWSCGRLLVGKQRKWCSRRCAVASRARLAN